MISLLAVGVIALTPPTTRTQAAPSPKDVTCAASAFWVYVRGDELEREASYPAFTFFIGKLSARSDAWDADFRACAPILTSSLRWCPRPFAGRHPSPT